MRILGRWTLEANGCWELRGELTFCTQLVEYGIESIHVHCKLHLFHILFCASYPLRFCSMNSNPMT
jgi:hypothetical protein